MLPSYIAEAVPNPQSNRAAWYNERSFLACLDEPLNHRAELLLHRV
jgi:hypothetical protein